MWTALVILLLEVHAVGAGWIDPDTPRSAYTTQALSSFVPPYTAPTELKSDENVTTPFPTDSPTSTPTMSPTQTERFELVFSDEFNVPGRTFEDGADPRWTALNKNDYTNNALHYYHPSMAQTDSNGDLIIKTNANKTKFIGFNDTSQKRMRATKNFKSAMLQTWNKFCFTGGIIEGQFQMPGKSRVGGLWPAFWLMGNLARHTYVGTSGHVWPWSSRDCSSISRSAQKISGCDRVLHYGLHNGMGRGSPEIDIFEMQPGNLTHNQGPFLRTAVGQPFMSASYQVAPGRPYNRPGPGYWPGPGQWYSGLKGGKNTSLNILFYGNYNYFAPKSPLPRGPYWSDAISFNRQVDESYFNRRHIYRLEWEVPSDTTDGSLHWFLDGELVLSINGTGIVEAGLGSGISSEPSYILLNTAISSQWGFPAKCPPGCTCTKYDCNSPNYQDTCGFNDGFCDMVKQEPNYKIDWVRVYQNPNNPLHKVGCSTPERPTKKYIEANNNLYKRREDKAPLKPIQRGGGRCRPSGTGVTGQACGGPTRGTCSKMTRSCQCQKGWTGPNCLASEGYDNIQWDPPGKIGFVPPTVFPMLWLLSVLGGSFVLILASAIEYRHKAGLRRFVPVNKEQYVDYWGYGIN